MSLLYIIFRRNTFSAYLASPNRINQTYMQEAHVKI